MKREQRNMIRRMQQFEMSLGRVTSDRSLPDDALAASITDALNAEGSTSADEARRPRESTDSTSSHVPRFNRAAPSLPLGSQAWIKQKYKSNATEIIARLQTLHVHKSKWPMLFEARYSADKQLAQLLLQARFTDDQLTTFCMSRPGQSQPLKAADGSLLAPAKERLPDKLEMLGK